MATTRMLARCSMIRGGNDAQRAITMPVATLADKLFPLALIRTLKGSAKDGVINVKRKPVLSLLPMLVKCTGKICLRRGFKGKGGGERNRSRSCLMYFFGIWICTYMWANQRAMRSNKPVHHLNYLLIDQAYRNEARRRLMTEALIA